MGGGSYGCAGDRKNGEVRGKVMVDEEKKRGVESEKMPMRLG